MQFELNNWSPGETYPYKEPFITWLDEENFEFYLTDGKWVKEQGIGVVYTFIDMSINFCIYAPKKWIEENCPKLFNYPKFFREKSKWGIPFKEKGLWFARLGKDGKYILEEDY